MNPNKEYILTRIDTILTKLLGEDITRDSFIVLTDRSDTEYYHYGKLTYNDNIILFCYDELEDKMREGMILLRKKRGLYVARRRSDY